MGQGWEFAQLEILIARYVICRSNGGEHLCLFDGVDAEVRFEIEIQVQHVFGIARLLGHDLQNFFFDRVVRGRLGCDGWRDGPVGSLIGAADGRQVPSQVRTLFIHEPDHVRQCGIVSQFAILVAWNAVDLADGREHFRLFDGVNPEIGFEIEIQVQHVFRIAGLLHHQCENAFLDRSAPLV